MTKPYPKVILILFTILILIVIDQGIKIPIDSFMEDSDDLMQVSDTIHLHPYLNAQDREEMLPLSEKTSLHIDFLMILQAVCYTLDIALCWLCAYFADRFFFWDTHRKRHPILTASIVCLMLAGLLSHCYIDEFVRGGTLDYICIAKTIEIPKQVGNHIHTVTASHHHFFDLADIYVVSSLLLTFVRMGLWCASFLKQIAADPQSISVKLKHPIRNIRSMTERGNL